MLQSKLRQYKSLHVLKGELETVQEQLVKLGCDPHSGKSLTEEHEPIASPLESRTKDPA